MQEAKAAQNERNSPAFNSSFDPAAFPRLPTQLNPTIDDKAGDSELDGSSNQQTSSQKLDMREASVTRAKVNFNMPKFSAALDALAEMPGKESDGTTTSFVTETDFASSSLPEQIDDEQLAKTMGLNLGQASELANS